MMRHIDYIHGAKLEPFSPPNFCQSGAGLQEYTYYYQKGYRQITNKLDHMPGQQPLRMVG